MMGKEYQVQQHLARKKKRRGRAGLGFSRRQDAESGG
jgi:hypothetical protein